MKRFVYILLFIATPFVFSACENEIEPGQNALMEMSNEWWVQLLVDDGNGGYEDIHHLGYFQFLTSNTASSTADSLFVDDFGDMLELKAKVAANPSDLTFGNAGSSVSERYTGGHVFIENGRIFINQGSSATGVTVDSIYFEAEFDWAPGQKYIVAGHGRTGFLEDEF